MIQGSELRRSIVDLLHDVRAMLRSNLARGEKGLLNQVHERLETALKCEDGTGFLEELEEHTRRVFGGGLD